MQSVSRWFVGLAAVALAACNDGSVVTPSHRLAADASLGAARISVLTRNLYVGADLTPAITALASPDPADDIPAIIATVAAIHATEWPVRVVALVSEIARTRPQVIGVQEVWGLGVDLRPVGLPVTLQHDFLVDLMAGIEAARLPYRIAAQVTSIDASPNALVRVIDRDLILVDTTRVVVTEGSVVSQIFAANVGPIAPGVLLLRGWVALEATINGMPVTIASTHLESGAGAALTGLRALQAQQLVTSLGVTTPAILMGDFNDIEGSPMYQIVADLGNAHAADAFDQRIDYVFTRGLSHGGKRVLGAVSLLGTRASERVDGAAGGLWPSDHAGVLAEILLPPSP